MPTEDHSDNLVCSQEIGTEVTRGKATWILIDTGLDLRVVVAEQDKQKEKNERR